MPHALPPLPYPYGALEPTIDELTMRLHPDKHHAGSVAGPNAAFEESAWADRPVEDVLGDLDLRYRYRRVDCLEAWWNVVDWQRVAARYATATSRHPGRERCRHAGGDHA